MARQERTHVNMEATDCMDTKQSKQRASVKWLLSKAFNNRVPENLQEPFYRDHEDQEHLKPPICGGLANAELYCLALANMYSDPNYHSLNHWNILQTFARKGVHVPDPPDCALTETVLIQTNPLKMSAHMCVIEALMVLYAREVVTLDRVSAAAHRFGVSTPALPGTGSTGSTGSTGATHEDGILCWVNAACTALNKAVEDESKRVPLVSNLQDLCDGTALAALVSFYCPEALPRSSVRVGRMASIQDCLHNLMLVHDFCATALPVNVFHMMPEDVTYMRGSMRQNLVAMLADLFNMLEVHPVKSVKYPSTARSACNAHGVRHSRCLPPPRRVPDLREPSPPRPPFTVPRGVQGRVSTPERRSCSPQREEFVVHRGRAVTTLASLARRDDDNGMDANQTAAGRPSNWAESRENTFAGRRSRRSSISDDSQLTVENFGGSQDRLHFAGRNPEKELATLANVRKISAPAGPAEYNPPLRSSRQDIRGSIQFIHGELTNGEHPRVERQHSSPAGGELAPRRPAPADGVARRGGGDGPTAHDHTDGDAPHKTSFADLTRRHNGDHTGLQSQFGQLESEQIDRRKTTTFSTPPANTTTWQQQFMQQENHPNGEDLTDDMSVSPNGGQAMAAQLNNIRLKLEEKRRRIEQDKRRMEMAVSRQRQQLGQQAFLQAVTRGKGTRTPPEHDNKTELNQQQEMVVEPPSQTVENVVLEQYQQSIAKMNSSLQDIQSDIARLASQQNQIQQQQQQQQQQSIQQQIQQQQQSIQQQQQQLQQQQAKQLFQQQQQPPMPQSPYQQHYQQNIPQLHSQFSSQHNVSRASPAGFGSTPHLPQYYPPDYRAPDYPHDNRHDYPHDYPHDNRHDYPHDNRPDYPGEPHEYQYRDIEERARQQFYLHESPPPAPRRTWAQHKHQHDAERAAWQVHQQSPGYAAGRDSPQRTWRSPSPQPAAWQPQGFVLHDRPERPDRPDRPERYQNGRGTPPGSPRRTPQPPAPVSLQQLRAPPDMEPQNISFIGSAEDEPLRHGIDRLNITSGTRTYRIPSPTRPHLARDSFRHQRGEEAPEKGFYISFDDDQPKRPKPPLRAKRGSPRKERSMEGRSPERGERPWDDRAPAAQPDDDEEAFVVHHARDLAASPPRRAEPEPTPAERARRPPVAEKAVIVVGQTEVDPNSAEEMERKKERIMLLSLQRRQRAEEARARADAAAAARRARDEAAEERKAARKEEQARRREAILAQYKLKKAMEEAEREGKVLDKSEFLESMRGAGGGGGGGGGAGPTRLRRGGGGRARPNTIHVDSGALHAAEGMLSAKQPSASSLAAPRGGGTMRRDYYRGSQDSLAERAQLYRDSPVEERGGVSPAGAGALARRGSCKTSRERVNEEPQSARGRSKYTSYQSNFKAGRKSSSLMNLCDSGLGRATPPRRAASPGVRALGSPAGSGPGSLPGAIGKRRQHDDNSDVSSTHSSIMDYSGPRLYKQPTTKSNRGIMLNAVEYCVFPGAVNAEAKRRVLEEIARSESKHFLVLFRDAGCQFRALYSFCPDTEQVTKLYGTGPKHVNDRMFDKFFKYNSGSKCFSQVHTKHLTVTIDAFTIHNSLWQGKKVQLPSKKDMALVI